MDGIFLNYRRDDTSGYAGRLHDRLVARFGKERVFMDLEMLHRRHHPVPRRVRT